MTNPEDQHQKILDIKGLNEIWPSVTPQEVALAHYRSIYNRIHKTGLSYFEIVSGVHRTGKSLFGLMRCILTDSTFWRNIESRIVYDAKGCLDALNEIRRKNIHGGFILFDEVGASLNSRDFYKEINKAFSATLQISGRWLPGVVYTVPDWSFMDSQARKMCHYFTEMYRNNKEYAIAKIFEIHIQKRTGDTYFKYPVHKITKNGRFCGYYSLRGIKIRIEGDEEIIVDGEKVKKSEILRKYEEISKEAKKKIQQRQRERTSYNSEDISLEGAETWSPKEILEHVVEHSENYISESNLQKGIMKISKGLVQLDFSGFMPSRRIDGLCQRANKILHKQNKKEIESNDGVTRAD